MANLTEEQTMLRNSAKAWVAEKSPVTAFRKMREAAMPTDSTAPYGARCARWAGRES